MSLENNSISNFSSGASWSAIVDSFIVLPEADENPKEENYDYEDESLNDKNELEDEKKKNYIDNDDSDNNLSNNIIFSTSSPPYISQAVAPSASMITMPTTPSAMITSPTSSFSTITKKASHLDKILLSPPISPETKTTTPQSYGQNEIIMMMMMTTTMVGDAVLYPSGHHLPSTSSNLFFTHNDNNNNDNDNYNNNNTNQMIMNHVATRISDEVSQILSPPQITDYTLAMEFKSQIGKAFNSNRRKWAQRELAQLKEDNQLRSRAWGCQHAATLSTTRIPSLKSSSHVRPESRKKSVTRLSLSSKNNYKNNINTQRISKNSGSKKNPTTSTNNREETIHTSKRVAREDKNFDSLPDFCPPLSSLPDRPNSLKVDWKGLPIDLTCDPFAHLLHPDEVQLAANLRLDCATYLTSKRRIFISRIAASKMGKDFRKTDAQQACKIDVNKASKLWQAFDKVGWLHPKWVPD